jgi:CHAT domain-containing protein/tetratricopeptide (TPR) repeat protein
MERFMMVLIILVLKIIVCADTGLDEQVQGQETTNDLKWGEEITNQSENEFFIQSHNLLIEILKEKDEKKIFEMKSRGIQLVRENLFFTVRLGNTLLDEAIRRELAGDRKESEIFFRTGKVLGEMYENAAGNSYLTDKVSLFNQWETAEKEKYIEAEKFYGQGEEFRNKYIHETAVLSYNKGLALYREIGYKEGEANCMKSMGDMHYNLKEYEQSIERYEQGLNIFREIKGRSGEADCLQSLGDMHLRLYENEKAREMYEQGLAIFREIKDRSGEAKTLQSLGDLHMISAEYKKAREIYEQGLAIYLSIGSKSGEAKMLQSLGDLHMISTEYKKAREIYEKVLVIYLNIGSRLGVAKTLKKLGDVHYQLNEKKNAKDKYEHVLSIYREIKDRPGEAKTLQRLGDVHLLLYEYEKALERYEQALAIFREIKDWFGEAKCLQSLGDFHLVLKEYEKARQIFGEALSLQKEIGDRYGMGQSYYCLGQTFEAMNNYPAAEKEYKNSIEIIEEVWQEMKREEFKTHYLVSNISPYKNLIHLLFKQNKGTQAFPYAERSKARSFLYLLGNKRIDIKKGVPLNLVRQEEELRQKITTLSRKIRENEEIEPIRRSSSAQLNDELLKLKEAHSETLEKIKLLCPEYASLVAVNPLSLEKIQTLLRDTGDTVFLEYYTTPDATFLWVLDGKDIFPYKIDIDSESLSKKVREYYTMISNPGTFGVETLEFQAQALYNLLMKPAETHWAGKTRIGVIPHSIIHYLPFEALMNNEKFLEEQGVTFFYLPSASVYKYCRDKNPLKKEQIIALGNPKGSLVFSEKEVEELKRMYPADTEIFTGAEAIESRVGYYGPYADILHFSCHGVFDAANPLYSALELAKDSSSDGRLEVQEIFQLNLKPAYLVTLSACKTNVSKISPGDEMVGLTRAFMYAGTPSVVASLWEVDDYCTEKLMVSFYRALKENDKITALHLARQEMIEKYGKRHPFYWAPFVLIGDFR